MIEIHIRSLALECCRLYSEPTDEQIAFFKADECKVRGIPNSVRITSHIPGNQLQKGQKITFACRQRHLFMRGNETVKCLENGQWSDPFPTCGGKSIFPFWEKLIHDIALQFQRAQMTLCAPH